MEQGVLNVGSNLLVLAEEALIIEENPFSASNMIQTNISFTDNGVKKFLPSGAGNFTFPVGSGGKYTPVKLSITANNSDSGSLLVKPAGEAHPSVLDVNNVLNYHWVVRADGLSGFAAEARMKYDIGDVKGNISNYITARLLSDGSGEWNKFSGEEVIDESTRELVFSFFSTDDAVLVEIIPLAWMRPFPIRFLPILPQWTVYGTMQLFGIPIQRRVVLCRRVVPEDPWLLLTMLWRCRLTILLLTGQRLVKMVFFL